MFKRIFAVLITLFLLTQELVYSTGITYNTGGACIGKGNDTCSVMREYMHTYDSDFSLSSKIIPDTASIGITHNGNEEYFLKKLDLNSGFFTYNVSTKFGNLVNGKNTYSVAFYDTHNKTLGKQYIFEVMYYNKDSRSNFIIKKGIRPQTEEEEGEENIVEPIYYFNTDNPNTRILRLKKDFGDYTLDLGGGYKFIYTTYLNQGAKKGDDPWSAKFKIQYKKPGARIPGNSNEIRGIDFSAYLFNSPSIKKYSNNYYIIETGAGHEGVSTVFAYSPKRMKIFNLYELEKKVLGNDAYPVFTATLVNGKAIITEFRYCCDVIENPGGYERIVIDIENEKLVSREVIKE